MDTTNPGLWGAGDQGGSGGQAAWVPSLSLIGCLCCLGNRKIGLDDTGLLPPSLFSRPMCGLREDHKQLPREDEKK